MTPQEACSCFLPAETTFSIARLGRGNVNDTWLVTTGSGEQWVLQRLRSAVFKDPLQVMHNLRLVVSHFAVIGGEFPLFSLCRTPEGEDYLLDDDRDCWRLLSYLAGTKTLDNIETPGQARSIGSMLGRFHQMLKGIDQEAMVDPLPGFHIPSRYLAAYDRVLLSNRPERPEELHCTAFIERLRSRAVLFEDPSLNFARQVIHGDPKVANFLFATDGLQSLSLIDLDTVKPGLLLHDLGDCLRSCCNPFGETVDDPARVTFDAGLFHAVLDGYCEVAADLFSLADRRHLVDAAHIITFELGLRFFTDHLSGNTYFKIRRPDHNLQRALVQFHLCDSINRQRDQLDQMVAILLKDHPFPGK